MRCIRSMFRQIAAGSGPAFEVLDACRGWLAERPDCTGKTGVIGFCMGGGFALHVRPAGGVLRRGSQLRRGPVRRRERRWPDRARSSGATAARDTMGVSHPQRLEAALTALGVPHDVKVYPEAGHSFMSPEPAALAPLHRTGPAEVRQGRGRGRLAADLRVLRHLPAGLETLAGLRVEVVVDEAVGNMARISVSMATAGRRSMSLPHQRPAQAARMRPVQDFRRHRPGC